MLLGPPPGNTYCTSAGLGTAAPAPVRRPGAWKGHVVIADYFDDTPPGVIAAFGGAEDEDETRPA